MDVHSEVVVIGGGIVGSAIAYYVAKSGYQVTLIEKGELASGTSSRCDGNILNVDKEPGYYSQMGLKSQELVKELSTELESHFEFRSPGSILVCETEEEMEFAQKWVEQQLQAGLSFRMLDRSDLKQESAYLADDLLGGLECSTDMTVNPYLLTYALFDGAKKYGSHLMKHTTVKNVTQDRVTKQFTIETDRGRVTAEKVINSGGVWAPTLGEMVGVEIPIKPRKGQIIVASRQRPVSPRKVMEFGYLLSKFGKERKVDEETEKYGVALVFEPTDSQNFLIGSSRQFVGFHTKVDMDVARCMARRACRFYPKMTDMNLIRIYAGLRPWTEDHLPIVSRVAEVPGYYIAAGHEGDGISLAPITGKLVSEMLLERNTCIPIEPLRYDRFSKKKACV